VIEPARTSGPRALGLRETRALLRRHGLQAKTGLGQHFVVDPNTVRKVVRLAEVRPGEHVLEIGPGLGALTLALVDAGARVIAVERDRSLAPALSEVLDETQVAVVWADAMSFEDAGAATKMVSNLPYQIATPLLLRLLERHPAIREHTFMVQREVGERFAAAPGSPAYGAVSVKVAWFARARVAARVSRRAFYPMPAVESVIVRVDRLDRPPVSGPISRRRVFEVIEAGFSQRRKTMRNALRGAGWALGDVERALRSVGVEATTRAEQLSLSDFAAVARALPSSP
jgi:16S rRNA (adenine1518-N6/adenine1519-N6)-dimethyltransferase